MNIGVQLYSVRGEIEKYGLEPVLEAVKEVGFDCVECAGFYGLSPEEMKATLDKFGLKAISIHAHILRNNPYDFLTEEEFTAQTLPYIDALGIEKVYIPWLTPTAFLEEHLDETLARVKRAYEILTSRKVTVGYHNHAHEYQNGNNHVKTLLDGVDGLTTQIDIFWTAVAEQDTLALMDEFGDDVSSIHVKELAREKGENGKLLHALVGEGVSNTEAVIQKALKKGIDTFILEVEGYPCEWKEYLKKSCDAIKAFAQKK